MTVDTLYLLSRRRRVSVYARKLNAVYDHVAFKREDKVRLREIPVSDFNKHTAGKRVHFADCIRTKDGFELFQTGTSN